MAQTKDDLVTLAKTIAPIYSLDPSLVCAVAEQESGWNPYSLRFEAGFYKKYLASRYTDGQCTESVLRATSFGLMQIMGESAREIGFDAASLAILIDPTAGLTWGCKLLSKFMTGAKSDIVKALLKWNGGSNKLYPGQVLARIDKYKS